MKELLSLAGVVTFCAVACGFGYVTGFLHGALLTPKKPEPEPLIPGEDLKFVRSWAEFMSKCGCSVCIDISHSEKDCEKKEEKGENVSDYDKCSKEYKEWRDALQEEKQKPAEDEGAKRRKWNEDCVQAGENSSPGWPEPCALQPPIILQKRENVNGREENL